MFDEQLLRRARLDTLVRLGLAGAQDGEGTGEGSGAGEAEGGESSGGEGGTGGTAGGDKSSDQDAEVKKWKSLARKHEAQAKANADKAKRLDELEESSKSELQKSHDRAAQAETRAEEAELRALRMEIAQEKGLTAEQAEFMIGNTREELEAKADKLAAMISNGDAGKKMPAKKPSERLRGGSAPAEDAEPSTKDILAKIPRL